ncbi:hypothetical protein RHMOL_Rhmol03G0222100 [Rhododendron molle]|uniref:Uncharacterized protein n=1 Tax=Rhododendron molle TaxID=49168 RepID=A0ACC0PIH5_RHOML|nr:hypothetical protein RHMOL_Rhmol03G0222100 [Rhododendron molle]
MTTAAAAASFFTWVLFFLLVPEFGRCVSAQIGPGSRLSTKDQSQAWVSDNGTFAFGFTPVDFPDQYLLAIWFAELPGDRTVVWSANRNSPVGTSAFLDFDNTGNLLLLDGSTTVWTSNTSGVGVEAAIMSETGNFILYSANQRIVWQSFSHPSDTLLPGQPLTVSLELKSSNSSSRGGYYTLNMLQQPTALSLALSYNLPESYDSSPDSYNNYSYWSGPEISNGTGEVVAILDKAGSFGVVYGASSDGAVYVYKNDADDAGLSSASNQSTGPSVLRRITLETNGNLRLYRWDNDVNGSHQWVPEWAAVSNPCDIAGICGNGICKLEKNMTNSSCTCLPGSSKSGTQTKCYGNSSVTGKCGSQHENLTSQFKIAAVQQTNYYYSDSSVIANYSDMETGSKCGNTCLSDCECVASVYGLSEEKAYCWILRDLEFGGFEDTGSTLFVKVESDGSSNPESNTRGSGASNDSDHNAPDNKVVVLPIVLTMTVLIGLLCCLLYFSVHRRRSIKRALQNSLLVVSGAPVNFSFRDLQCRTNNFSHLLGTGGFGHVYKGSLGDSSFIAVKKLDRVLPHGEKEFITEVNTIGSMHHMNLVRLCGYCSEGSHRYEMENGTPLKVADRRMIGTVEEEELVRALRVAFWCIQDEVSMRPSMGEVVKMLEGSVDINVPPMPQTVLELIEEGLDHVYKAMRREFNQFSSFTITSHPSSRATCSYSTMSPR